MHPTHTRCAQFLKRHDVTENHCARPIGQVTTPEILLPLRRVDARSKHAAEFWPEPARVMQAWADYLDELRGDRRIVPPRRTQV
jgi:hypothetical protein